MYGLLNQKPIYGTPLDPYHPLCQGIAVCYPINEGGGSLYDLSSNYVKGTLGAGVTWSSGQLGRCLSFNGGSAAAVTTPGLTIAGSLTFACWFLIPATISGSQYLAGVQISSSSGLRLLRFVTGTNLLQFTVISDTSTSTVAQSSTGVVAAKWIHAAGVLDAIAGSITLYVNGVPTATTATSGTFAITRSNFTLGARPDSNTTLNFSGQIALFSAHARALSAGEISALYANSWQLFGGPSWVYGSATVAFPRNPLVIRTAQQSGRPPKVTQIRSPGGNPKISPRSNPVRQVRLPAATARAILAHTRYVPPVVNSFAPRYFPVPYRRTVRGGLPQVLRQTLAAAGSPIALNLDAWHTVLVSSDRDPLAVDASAAIIVD